MKYLIFAAMLTSVSSFAATNSGPCPYTQAAKVASIYSRSNPQDLANVQRRAALLTGASKPAAPAKTFAPTSRSNSAA